MTRSPQSIKNLRTSPSLDAQQKSEPRLVEKDVRPILLTDSDIFAGTEKHIFELSRALAKQNIMVSVCCPETSPLRELAKYERINVHTVPQRSYATSTLRLLRKLISENSVNVVHAHNGVTHLIGFLSTRANSGALVATSHFLNNSRSHRKGVKGFLSGMAHKMVARGTHQFISVSNAVADSCTMRGDFLNAESVVVYNGIDAPADQINLDRDSIRQSLSLKIDAPTIVCVARLADDKQVDLLIQAMEHVVKEVPDVQCIVVGEGNLRKQLQNQIQALGVEKHIRLIGHRENVHEIVSASDVFVLPGKYEGFGLSLIEAMIVKKPTVAINAGGPKEIVEHGVTGYLSEPDNAVELAGYLTELLKDDTARDRLGNAAHLRYQSFFSAEHMARKTASVYEEALGKARKG